MIIIKTSTDSHKVMKMIANELLNNKLAACVNMIPRMRSKYVMDGRITESREVILLIKTTEKLEQKVYQTIKELHNYEIPEISTIQTSNVDKDYEQWLKDFVEEQIMKIEDLSEATILKAVILTLLLIMIITVIVVIAIKYPQLGVQ